MEDFLYDTADKYLEELIKLLDDGREKEYEELADEFIRFCAELKKAHG